MERPLNGHDLVVRLDERVHDLQEKQEKLLAQLNDMNDQAEKRRALEERNRRVDRFTMMGIAVALAGVAISVLGIVNG